MDFFARIELHNDEGADYSELWDLMERLGWSRTIMSDDGKEFQLPGGTYSTSSDRSATQLRDEISEAISEQSLSPEKRAWVLVVRSGGWSFHGQRAT
jgi:hypothetical protein